MNKKLLQISDFASLGINSDIAPWNLPIGHLTNIVNVRIAGNRLVPAGGYSNKVDLPVGFIARKIIYHYPHYVLFGDDKIYAYNGDNFFDISSGSYLGGEKSGLTWFDSPLSNILIANNKFNYPEYWDNVTANNFMPLPWDSGNTWADVSEKATIIRSHKQFLIAMGLQTGGKDIEDGIRWSTPADVGGVPSSWDPLDTTKSAGITSLGGGGGAITDGLSLRDSFVLYRRSGISVMDYVGGNFIWRIRHLSSFDGLASSNSVVEIDGKHYFISNEDIVVTDGTTLKSLIHNRLRKIFNSKFDPDNFSNAYTIANKFYKEIWFCIPTVGNEFPDLAFVYNWKDDSWALRDLYESPDSVYGPSNTEVITYENVNATYNDIRISYSQADTSSNKNAIISIDNINNKLIDIDNHFKSNDVNFSVLIERLSFSLDNLDSVNTITGIYPHFSGSGKVYIQIGSQDSTTAPIRWKPIVEFDVAKDRKIDMRTTGSLHCFRITSNDNSWDLSGIDLEYIEAGLR